MRKHHALLNWLRRDPRHYRFALPNAVQGYHLRPVEFVILSYLYCSAHSQADRLAPEVVAEGVHLTVTSVKKYINGLLGKGLVADGWSLTPALQITSSEKIFILPNEVFLLRLPPSAFVVYTHLLLIEDRRTHTCHPSYNTIAYATGLFKNTALKSVGILLEKGLISIEATSYFD